MRTESFITVIAAAVLMLAGCRGLEPETVRVTDVEVAPAALTLEVGEKRTLQANVLPADADNGAVWWSSDNASIAAVDPATGEVRGAAEGSATITVTTEDGGKTATCAVTVNSPAPAVVGVTGVEIVPQVLVLTAGERYALRADVMPENADNKSVSWSSDNASVAAVDPVTGELTALAEGSATITVTTEDGGKTAACSVTVNPAPDPDNILTLIPDPVFRAWCTEATLKSMYDYPAWDTNGDGKLSPAEAAKVKGIICANGEGYTGPKIVSMQGIEHFTGIILLRCGNNEIASLDISGNTALVELLCFNNKLEELDLSKNPAIGMLWCWGNALTELDVSNNPKLAYLYCDNNRIAGLDLSKNPALKDLFCGGNLITGLDLSKNPALWQFECYDNLLTEMDVSANPKLRMLLCNGNRIASVSLPDRADALIELWCHDNLLTGIDVSNCSVLTILKCRGNPGDGVSKFPVKCLFDNSSIPNGMSPTGYYYDFTKESWEYDGKTIAVDYRK